MYALTHTLPCRFNEYTYGMYFQFVLSATFHRVTGLHPMVNLERLRWLPALSCAGGAGQI